MGPPASQSSRGSRYHPVPPGSGPKSRPSTSGTHGDDKLRGVTAARSLFSNLQTALKPRVLSTVASLQITPPTESISSTPPFSSQLSQPPPSSSETVPRNSGPLIDLIDLIDFTDDTAGSATAGSSLGHDEIAREGNDGNPDTAKDQDERSSSTLESLITTRIPLDITDHVVIPDYRRQVHGGLAVVYLGLWSDKRVAVKVLKIRKHRGAYSEWDMSNERRIKREMHVWAALKHPNIIEFLGYLTDLSDLSDYPAMVSPAQDVSHGLEYLHQLKVIHGDVKPANILVDDDGVAKLCDFGLVRLVDWEGPAGMTTTSPYTGTERYKAPELFISQENRQPVATFDGDIYSLGCIMLEMIEGIYPFQRFTNTYELRGAIIDGYSPALRSETTHALLDMTDFFWNLLEACWSVPSDRPDIKVIVDALNGFAGTTPNPMSTDTFSLDPVTSNMSFDELL